MIFSLEALREKETGRPLQCRKIPPFFTQKIWIVILPFKRWLKFVTADITLLTLLTTTSKLDTCHLPASIQEQCKHMACPDQYSSLRSKKNLNIHIHKHAHRHTNTRTRRRWHYKMLVTNKQTIRQIIMIYLSKYNMYFYENKW